MNTSVQTAVHTAPQSRQQNFITVLLAVAVFVSALAVVYVSDLNRRLFISYQNEQETYNHLYIEWGKLLLEQSTWSTQARVANIAGQRLGMFVPTSADIVLFKMNSN